ncbi:polymorphic toxin-type HINT domain-containing protein [Embleya sp. NPDC059213]|uniref:polymorphic toxin-type HINT domain-containing protein n=2 Tax=Embleya TaxID=2699295 RepID=UPI0036920A43
MLFVDVTGQRHARNRKRNSREIGGGLRLVALCVATVMTTTLITAQASAVARAPRGGVELPELQADKPVAGADSTAEYRPPAAPEQEYKLDRTTAPDGGTGVIVIGGGAVARSANGATDTGLKQVAGLPILIGPAAAGGNATARTTATTNSPTATGSWTVTVSDRTATEAAGIDGVLMKLEPSPDATAVQLAVDYAAFEKLYGAGWGSRLRLVQFPECFLTTPDLAGCAEPVDLASTNDAKADRVSTVVDPTATPPAPQGGTLRAAMAGGAMVLAATGGGEGNAGDYKATDLKPSGTWTAGGSSGNFSWEYPLGVPPVASDLGPKLSLGYSSQSVDGRTSTSNNQASWLGEGWDYHPGFIERAYQGCKADDAAGNNNPTNTGDLCWRNDNAVMSLGGSTTPLIKDDATGKWKPGSDDGTRIEQKFDAAGNGDDNGENWVVTTPDGTRYHFGLNKLPGWTTGKPTTDSVLTVPVFGNHPNEPCHQTAFANSSCVQGWRWNLDYVEDTHGNAMAVYWRKETNHYARNGVFATPVAYDRAAYPTRIDYGLRKDDVFGVAPARVTFTTAERCIVTATFNCAEEKFTKKGQDAKQWPDTPADTYCASTGKCYVAAPTFWSRKRLTMISTQVTTAPGVNEYRMVDSWEFKQGFQDTRYDTNPPLWLESITRTGRNTDGGTLTLPPVSFYANTDPMPNRVSAPTDDRPGFERLRVAAIHTETGGGIRVHYSAPCDPAAPKPTPATNTSRCYPVMWQPGDEADPKVPEWFNKYVVTRVDEEDFVGGGPTKSTRYEYADGAAWAKDDAEFGKPSQLTWSQWRGYARVITRTGTTDAANGTVAGKTETRFFRGMHGDVIPGGNRVVQVKDSTGAVVADDLLQYQGMPAETITYTDDGQQIAERELTAPWHRVTSTHVRTGLPTLHGYQVGEAGRTTIQYLSGGRTRTATSTVTFDPTYGLPERSEDNGDLAVQGDEQCVVNTYAHNTAANILGAIVRTRTTSGTCADADTAGADRVVNDVKTAYDDLAVGQPPTKGNPSDGYQVRADGINFDHASHSTFDAAGRVLVTTNTNGKTTAVTYTPVAGGAAARVDSVDPLGNTLVTTNDIGRGRPLTAQDVAGDVYRTEYDALGRLIRVWQPGRHAAGLSPGVEYEYQTTGNKPNVVTTRTIKDDGTYSVAKTLYDGLLRPRQTQSQAGGNAGRLITDTLYNTSGSARRANGTYLAGGAPTDALYIPQSDTEIPKWQTTAYDGLGRPLRKDTWNPPAAGAPPQPTFSESTEYGGDNTTTVPPPGGTAQRVWTDMLGRAVRLDQFTNAQRTQFTRTAYTYDLRGNRKSVVDPGGNTWAYTYDARGQMTRSDDPDKGTTTYAYDNLGRQTSSTDARGVTLTTVYDDVARKTAVHRGDVTGPKLSEWVYDTVKKGQPTSATRYDDGHAYTTRTTGYDIDNRPTGKVVTIPAKEGALAGNYEYRYTYTPTGAIAETSLPGAAELAPERLVVRYNTDGLPISTSGHNWYVSDATYSPYGEVLRTAASSAPTRIWTTNYYDPNTGRVVRSVDDKETGPDNRVTDTRYRFDPIGNVTAVTAGTGSGPTTRWDTQCFTYDALRQMTEAWTSKTKETCASAPAKTEIGGPDPYWQSFTFDIAGNRLTETQHDTAGDDAKNVTRAYGYHPTPTGPSHRLASVTSTSAGGSTLNTYGYDAVGNTTTRQEGGDSQTLTWGPDNRLATVTDPTHGPSQYVHDADGNRLIGRTAQGTTLYLGETEVTVKPDGSLTADRYYGQAGAPTVIRTAGVGKTLNLLLPDHHGTATTTVGLAPGMPIQRRKLKPFGEDRGTTPSMWPGSRGFVGGTNDTSTGLTHLGAREYDKTLGRFISVDPVLDLADPLQMNGYVYGHNNPVTAADPSGEFDFLALLSLIVRWAIGLAQQAAKLVNVSSQKATFVDHPRKPQHRTPPKIRNGGAGGAGGKFGARATGLFDDVEWDWGKVASATGDWIGNKAKSTWNLLNDTVNPLPAINACRKDPSFSWDCGDTALSALGGLGKTLSRLRTILKDAEKAKDASRVDIPENKPDAPKAPACVPGQSFIPGTKILMADGTHKPIEEIKLGDAVLATDPETGETTAKTVTALITSENLKNLTQIRIDDDEPGTENAPITATGHHPFWTADTAQWTRIDQLSPGDHLATAEGNTLRIAATHSWQQIQRVHNLTVADTHTYYVVTGTSSALVHNSGPCPHVNLDGVPEDLRSDAAKVITSMDKDGSLPPGVKRGGTKGKPGIYGGEGLPPAPPNYYAETDILPTATGAKRPASGRLVFGAQGEIWYTGHYKDGFTQLRGPQCGC